MNGAKPSPFPERLVLFCLRRWGAAAFPGRCNLCGFPSLFIFRTENYREEGRCLVCRGSSRARQMKAVLLDELEKRGISPRNATIWNTEARRALHASLKTLFGGRYVASEYLDPDMSPGSVVAGVRHEDVRKTSFPSGAFDFVLASDVLEHIPDPARALIEVRRVLKPGGALIFTVPFGPELERTETRAALGAQGEVVHLKPPLFHEDPLRPGGKALVFHIFGRDLGKLCTAAGLQLDQVDARNPAHGVLGTNQVVFVARNILRN